jgi:hypothetical protein
MEGQREDHALGAEFLSCFSTARKKPCFRCVSGAFERRLILATHLTESRDAVAPN